MHHTSHARAGRTATGSTWIRRVVATAAVVALGATAVASTPPAGAQASFVFASVRTTPTLPQPGQDVHVTVRITGCPPGDTEVDLLLQADPAGGVASALMATAPARTSLLWRTRAQIDLPSAVQGWYGVRVQCGTYVPPEVPLTGTSFSVGVDPAATMSVSPRTVSQGGIATVRGTSCPGPSVDYEVVPRGQSGSGFSPTGSTPTRPDGSWSVTVPIAANFVPGGALVRARCAVPNHLGATVYVSYGFPLDLTIARAP